MSEEFLKNCEQHERVARKDYKCCECRGIISKGEKHQCFTGIDDDDGRVTYRRCLFCNKLCEKLDAEAGDPYDVVAFGDLVNCVDDVESFNARAGLRTNDAVTEGASGASASEQKSPPQTRKTDL